MSPARVLSVALLSLALGACNLIHIDTESDRQSSGSHAFISGFVDAGWTDDDPLLDVDLFQNALISIDVWKLVRVELGLVGASVGVGPFDAGLGLLFYEARPPRYRWSLTGDEQPREEWRAPARRERRERDHRHEHHGDEEHEIHEEHLDVTEEVEVHHDGGGHDHD